MLARKDFMLNLAWVIIIEGIFLYAYAQVMAQLELKIFIDAPEYLRIKRRVIRNTSTRGYTVDDVLYRLEYQVEPAHTLFVEPFKHEADLIIPNKYNFNRGLEVLENHILQVCKKF